MAERHTIETYGRAPHNRNIWSTATERQTIETYGRGPYNRNIWSHTIARRRRRRHAWPILLSVLLAAFIPLLLTHCRMFTSKVQTNDSRLLQESNLAASQPQVATSVIQAITGEGLAQGPYLAARGGVEPTTFCTDNLHHNQPRPYPLTCPSVMWATVPDMAYVKVIQN